MPQTQTDTPALSQIERVADTFVAPTETFQDILRSASWWLPFLLLALGTMAVSFSIGHKVGFEQIAETQIHASPARESQLNSLEPAARAAQLHQAAVVTEYISYAYPVLVLIVSAFAALVLWATFNFGLGARTTYSQMLSLWMYASLPLLLTTLITLVTLWFAGSPESFNVQYPAGTNLGYYLTDSPAWMRTLLTFFDVFGIWRITLLILGGAVVARVKVGMAAAVILGWWLLIVIVSVASTAMFNS